MLGFEFVQRSVHGSADFHLAGTFAAGDLKAHHRHAVEQRSRAGLGNRVFDRGYLVEAHALAVGQRQLQIGQFFCGFDRGQGAHGLLAAAQVGTATGALGLHLLELAGNVCRRSAQTLQLHRVEGHFHFAGDATHTGDRAHALHAQQAAGHGVVHKPAQGLIVHLGRADGERQNRRTRQVHLVDHRVAHIARQLTAHALHGTAHFVQRLLGGLLQAEFGGDGNTTVLHLGVDVFQTLDGRNRVFQLAGHFGFQLGRRRTGQAGRDGDVGQLQVRELLHLHAVERQHAGEGQHHKKHDRRYGVFDGPRRDVHTASCRAASKEAGATSGGNERM